MQTFNVQSKTDRNYFYNTSQCCFEHFLRFSAAIKKSLKSKVHKINNNKKNNIIIWI